MRQLHRQPGNVRTTMLGADYSRGPLTVGLSVGRTLGLRTVTEITLPRAKRPKRWKTGCARVQLATLYRSLS